MVTIRMILVLIVLIFVCGCDSNHCIQMSASSYLNDLPQLSEAKEQISVRPIAIRICRTRWLDMLVEGPDCQATGDVAIMMWSRLGVSPKSFTDLEYINGESIKISRLETQPGTHMNPPSAYCVKSDGIARYLVRIPIVTDDQLDVESVRFKLDPSLNRNLEDIGQPITIISDWISVPVRHVIVEPNRNDPT